MRMDGEDISEIAWVGFSSRASGGGASHAGHVPVRYTSLRPKRISDWGKGTVQEKKRDISVGKR